MKITEISHPDMLTPERLTELRNAGPDYYVSGGTLKLLLAHIDAQQARIADIEAQNASLLSLLADIRIACGDNGKRMQDELVAYISDLEQDAARYRWLRDNGELPMVIIGSRWYGTQHAGCLDLNEFVDSEMQK